MKLRLDAAKELFDRGWGRPMQYHSLRHQEAFLELCETLGEKAREIFGDEGWNKVSEAARGTAS